MADKRISQLVDRGTVANNDVVPIVVSGASTTNKATISSIQTFMQGNLDMGVTSVGLSMPSAFVVSNSPVTASGNISVTGAGTVSQYIRGDGSLADFPSGGGGGGSSVNYYLNGSVSQGTIGGIAYQEMNKVPVLGAGTDFTIAADGYIASFITDAGDPALLEIPAGNWNFETYLQASSGGGTPSFYIELYKVNSGGTATLIASNSATPELIAFGTTTTPYFSALAVPTTSLALTDRLALRYYVTHSGRTITLHTENATLCQIITTFTTGLTALNGLTAQVQNFATGTSGNDFGISSSVSTHTFNLPTASSSNRGALSSADWITFNNKQPAGNYVTTDTSQSITANKSFTVGFNLGSEGSGNQPSFFRNTSSLYSGSASSNIFGFNNQNNIYFGKGSVNGGVLQWNNAAVRYYTLPNSDGTLALTSDLAAYLPLTGGTLSNTLFGTTSIFGSAFASNQTSKIGIGFESGYGKINSWGADTSTYGGLSFEISKSNGDTYQALRINPDGTLYASAGGYYGLIDAAFLKVGGATAFSQVLTPPVAKFVNSANNFVKIALGQGETNPNFNDYYGIIALDNSTTLANNKLRFYLGYDDAATPGHSNDQLVIQGDGNVGIGTATPSAKLHVMGTATLTGALNGTSASFSGLITSTVGNSGTLLKSTNATTSFQVGVDLRNTGGLAQFGVESSVGGTFVNNSTAYASIFGSGNATAAEIQTNGTVRLSIASTGAATFSSSVTAKGILTLGESLVENGIINSPEGIYINADSDASGGTNDIVFGKGRTSTSGGTTFMTIKNGGNVGIGTALPNSILEAARAAANNNIILTESSDSGDDTALFYARRSRGTSLSSPTAIQALNNIGGLAIGAYNGSAYAIGAKIKANSNQNWTTSAQGTNLIFETTADNTTTLTERMRITSGGNVLIGTDSTPSGSVGGAGFIRESNARSTFFMASTTTGVATLVVMRNPNGDVGTIVTNGSSTSYNTSSDYRLKENVKSVDNALSVLTQLKPCTFNFIADAEEQIMGFIAHEVQEVMPQAVSGEKDGFKIEEVEVSPAEIDEEGNIITEAVIEEKEIPVYQGIDHSKLVPLLVAAIQELKTEIDSLKNQMQ